MVTQVLPDPRLWIPVVAVVRGNPLLLCLLIHWTGTGHRQVHTEGPRRLWHHLRHGPHREPCICHLEHVCGAGQHGFLIQLRVFSPPPAHSVSLGLTPYCCFVPSFPPTLSFSPLFSLTSHEGNLLLPVARGDYLQFLVYCAQQW